MSQSTERVPMTKEDVANFIKEIEVQEMPTIHTMIALDKILREPNCQDLLDQDLTNQARDIWLKVKANGLELEDPPILFGVPPLPEEQSQDEAAE